MNAALKPNESVSLCLSGLQTTLEEVHDPELKQLLIESIGSTRRCLAAMNVHVAKSMAARALGRSIRAFPRALA